MLSSERRKLSKLLRRGTAGSSQSDRRNSKAHLKRLNSPSTKISRKDHHTSNDPEINDTSDTLASLADFRKLCCEMSNGSGPSIPMTDSAATLLQGHLSRMTRLIVQHTIRFMEQSCRGVPHSADIDNASISIGLEPAFGTGQVNFLPIRSSNRVTSQGPGSGGKPIVIRPEKELDALALAMRDPAGVVYDMSLMAHWVAINGKQPVIAQNCHPDFIARMSALNGRGKETTDSSSSINRHYIAATNQEQYDNAKVKYTASDKSSDGGDQLLNVGDHPRQVAALIAPRRRHVISQEMMAYFREITEGCSGCFESKRHEVLTYASTDPGLQPLLPYLTTFIAEGVRLNILHHNLAILIYLLRLTKALFDNPHLHLHAYLHLLMPSAFSCVVANQLCAKQLSDNHWALRDYAAKQLVAMCSRYNNAANDLQSRLVRQLSCSLTCWIEGCKKTTTSSSSSTSLPIVDHQQQHSNSSSGPVSNNNNSSDSRGGATLNLGNSVDSFDTLYGLVVTLVELGPHCLRLVLFPLLGDLCTRLTSMTCSPPSSATAAADPSSQATNPATMMTFNPKRLSPAELRSFEHLQAMFALRLSTPLVDWRTRRGMGIALADFRQSYGPVMADCLHGGKRNESPPPPAIIKSSSPPPAATKRLSEALLHRPPPQSNLFISTAATTTPQTTSTSTTLVRGPRPPTWR